MDATSANYIATPKRIVLGNINNQGNASPISPMANLKLLIKVATSHDTNSENSSDMVMQASEKLQEANQRVQSKYTRQLRSLGFICKKFLQLYALDIPSGGQMQLSLVNLAQVLEIEKRRIYDIINVVASLNMAVKVCKDRYIWYGNQHLTSMLCKLKIYALQNNLDQLVQSANMLSNMRSHEVVENVALDPFSTKPTGDHSMIEDNRIGILCQKFIMLFLVSPQGSALNLNLVSRLILPRDIQDKTGMRRLYDIANVLESLGLIKRHSIKTFRKPSFVYCGPNLPSDQASLASMSSKTTEQPFVDNIDSNDSFSSAEGCHKLDEMLEVVCTELERIEKTTAVAMRAAGLAGAEPSAKKQLFPSTEERVGDEGGEKRFIKAPARSFRLLCNTITEAAPISDAVPTSDPDRSSGLDAKVGARLLDQLENNNNEPTKQLCSTVDHRPYPNEGLPKMTVATMKKDALFPTIKLNKIARPITIYKPVKLTSANIQNGGIYKAVKKGDTIHLVKL